MQKSVSLNFYGVALIFFLFFLCWGRATFANEWRFLDPLTHTSNSKCIGEPKTALCAAETYAACFFSGIKKLCSAVGIDYDAELGDLSPGAIGRLYLLYYYVIDHFTLSAENIPDKYPKFGGRSWQPGDLALRMAWRTCQPDLQCLKDKKWTEPLSVLSCRSLETCKQFPYFEVFNILRKTGAKWSIIGDYRREDLTEVFQHRK